MCLLNVCGDSFEMDNVFKFMSAVLMVIFKICLLLFSFFFFFFDILGTFVSRFLGRNHRVRLQKTIQNFGVSVNLGTITQQKLHNPLYEAIFFSY